MEHSETEGKVDGRNEQPVENKRTVEESGMVGAKSGADDQSVPPAGREGEASQNEWQTTVNTTLLSPPQKSLTIAQWSTVQVNQSKQPVPVEQSGMVSQGQQGEISGADDQASPNE